jgi:hypothetical protein
VVSEAALPLLAGTHQLYVKLLVPLRREHKILSHKKGKSIIELSGVSLGSYLLVLRS